MSRQHSVSFLLSSLLATILFFSGAAQAQQDAQAKPPSKEGKSYVSASIVLNEFRSVELVEVLSSDPSSRTAYYFPLTAQTYGIAATYGTYITDNFKTEVRYGTGVADDTLKELLTININYYFNWYIGGTLPVTDYMSVYALSGISFYDADVTKREVLKKGIIPSGTQQPIQAKVRPGPSIDDELFGTKFSMSWILGFDLKVYDNWYLAFEYGRLIKDTDSNIKVYQAGTQLRYEF